MKTIISLILTALFLCNVYSQDIKEKKIKTDIKSILVFLEGAEVLRTKTVKLEPGRNRVIFEDLSPKIQPKSIRVVTDDDASVLAVSSKINYLNKHKDSPKIKQLKDSLELIRAKNIILSDDKDALSIEKNMIVGNMKIGGEQNGVSISELKQAADFYRLRIKDINKQNSILQKKINDNNKIVSKLNRELAELNANSGYQRTEISVLLSSEVNQTVNINLKYLVSSAGWTPTYDLKAVDISKPIELIYRAQVFNNTNIDWKNIDVVLSTADPSLSAAQPKLKPWYLNYYSNNYKGDYNKRGQKQSMVNQRNEGYVQNQSMDFERSADNMKIEDFNTVVSGKTEPIITYEEIFVSELSAEFKIDKKYTIPSDAKPYFVDVATHNLDATFKYFSAPKLDRDAFLIARITGWEDLNLIEGPANVYYGNAFVGKSYIYTRNVKDTLELSFGRDKKVLVTRSKLKNYSSTKFIGSKRKETLSYEMIIKNNRKMTIDIDLQDQIPVSQNDEIEVSAIEISDAKQDNNSGKLKWNFKIAPGQAKKIRLTFSIKYPKNSAINIKQEKKRYRAKF